MRDTPRLCDGPLGDRLGAEPGSAEAREDLRDVLALDRDDHRVPRSRRGATPARRRGAAGVEDEHVGLVQTPPQHLDRGVDLAMADVRGQVGDHGLHVPAPRLPARLDGERREPRARRDRHADLSAAGGIEAVAPELARSPAAPCAPGEAGRPGRGSRTGAPTRCECRPRSSAWREPTRGAGEAGPSAAPGWRSPPFRRRTGTCPGAPTVAGTRAPGSRAPRRRPGAPPTATAACTAVRCWRRSPGLARPARISRSERRARREGQTEGGAEDLSPAFALRSVDPQHPATPSRRRPVSACGRSRRDPSAPP